MTGYWYIDGIDIYLAYGLIIERGSADLLRIPPRKESISHSWMDKSGVDYDTDFFFFDERTTTLNVGMLADSEETFWQQYEKLVAHLSRPGLRRLEMKAHPGKQYYFIYKECGSVSQVVPLTGELNGFVGQKFTITITEPNPNPAEAQTQAISDEDGRIIIT